MPYSGVPKGSDTEKKIERCVKEVMAKNPSWSKSRAIATCRSSIEKKEREMPKTKNGMTSRQRRKSHRQQEQELLKAVNSGMPVNELYDEIEDEEMDLPPDLKELVSEFGEPEEKMYDEAVPSILQPGPTTFDELDAMREEEEKSHKLRMISYDAEDIVFNIIRNPELSSDEKAKKMAKVGEDMKSRIDGAMMGEKEEKEFDYDLASTELLLDMTDDSLSTKITDWFNKAMLSSGKRKELPDSAFALVETRDGQKIRKYPIMDKAHVRNALARAAQQIKAGGQAAADARKALPKIKAAAKKMGIGQPSKKNSNAIVVHKEANGEYRFVGWVSGKWIDRDQDIIPEEAHKEFQEFIESNPDYQINFRSWHLPGSERSTPIDFWTYKDGFVIVSGKLNEKEAERLMKAQQKQRLGMSHGFFGVRDEHDNRIIRKYRTFEVSDLPLDNAAFPWSDLSTIMEAKSMNTKLEYLKSSIGEDRLKSLLEDAEIKKSFLESMGIEAKEFDAFLAGEELPVVEPDTKEEGGDEPALTPEVVDVLKKELGLQDVDLATLKETVEQAQTVNALLPAVMAQLETLQKELAESKKDAAEQLADLITGAKAKRDGVMDKRSSESDETVVDEDDEQFKNVTPKHENTWLTDVMHTTPVAEGGK